MDKDTFFKAIENYAAKARNYFTAPVLIVIFAVLLLLGITLFQKYCDKRDAAVSDEKVATFDAQATKSTENFDRYLELFNKQHQATAAIQSAVAELSKTVSLLVENDRKRDIEVENLLNEYEKARFQKNNQNIVSGGAYRPNRPLLERETDALAADRELYPAN